MSGHKTIDQILASLRMNSPAIVTTRRPRIRRRNHKSNRVMRRWVWEAYEMNIPEMKTMNNDKIFVGASDYTDYLISNLFEERNKLGHSTFHREIKVVSNHDSWMNFVENEFDGDYIVQMTNTVGLVVTEGFNFIKYSTSSNSTEIELHGDMIFIDNVKQIILSQFEEVKSYIEWMYSGDGSSVSVPLNVDRLPLNEMYPFLNGESLESYYERFMSSTANILLLIGPPGTGKTTFIRGLLAHTETSAIVTYDASILEKDYLFARFIEDSTNVMVLEDSDTFLKARSDGNTMMHRFLNVGDGLVTTKGKKLIFSTNLPSIRDVDQALIRPGRCFDILHFDQLDVSQAKTLADKLGVQLPKQEAEKYSIAEIFNEKQIDVPKNTGTKFGFI